MLTVNYQKERLDSVFAMLLYWYNIWDSQHQAAAISRNTDWNTPNKLDSCSTNRHQALIGWYYYRRVTLVWNAGDVGQMASVLATQFELYAIHLQCRSRSLRARHCSDLVSAADSIAHKTLSIKLTPRIAPKTLHSLYSPFEAWPDDVSLLRERIDFSLGKMNQRRFGWSSNLQILTQVGAV